jgi:hypothetical protein
VPAAKRHILQDLAQMLMRLDADIVGSHVAPLNETDARVGTVDRSCSEIRHALDNNVVGMSPGVWRLRVKRGVVIRRRSADAELGDRPLDRKVDARRGKEPDGSMIKNEVGRGRLANARVTDFRLDVVVG